jgi:hypothetical protein
LERLLPDLGRGGSGRGKNRIKENEMPFLLVLVFSGIALLLLFFAMVFDPFEARKVHQLKIEGKIKTVRYEDIVDKEGWVIWLQGTPRIARFYWSPGKSEDDAWELFQESKHEDTTVFENQGFIWFRIKLGLLRKPVSTFRYIS